MEKVANVELFKDIGKRMRNYARTEISTRGTLNLISLDYNPLTINISNSYYRHVRLTYKGDVFKMLQELASKKTKVTSINYTALHLPTSNFEVAYYNNAFVEVENDCYVVNLDLVDTIFVKDLFDDGFVQFHQANVEGQTLPVWTMTFYELKEIEKKSFKDFYFSEM